MTEVVGPDQIARLHLAAVGLVLTDGLRVDDAVVLAEDLLASGVTGQATVTVASLERGAIRSEAEEPIREMLAEHGISVPVFTDEDDEYRVLLTAFGYWNLPLHFFEGPFYARIPAWDAQGPLDRKLVILLDRRDHETSPDARQAVEDELRAAVRACVPEV
ncbi:hypothetical protein M6D93_04390 [Jatrophihabitans telluris]|uniref:Uncharacterized protein n=1 Tax=Jatrophihabitans telluris TaxID=2038343 RepID=A0ABY4R015_9ACTN|nr:hypothetical protein [Jatrophihabitans telluris]UQX89246.1 hypothetical protein M6D93_04390 [Jatrophihabitans telluris]